MVAVLGRVGGEKCCCCFGSIECELVCFCPGMYCISSRYGWTIVCAMSGFVCVVSIVMSSAYVTILMCGDWGVGRSDVYRLKSVGDSTPPCGTPVLVMRCFDVVLLYVVYCLRPFM